MRHRVILLGLLCLTLLLSACKGDLFPTPVVPASNYFGINLDAFARVLNPGESFQVRAQGLPVGGAATVDLTAFVQWRSSAPDKASVSSTGLVTGVSPGDAVITANLSDDISGSSLTSSTLFITVVGDPGAPPPTITLQGLSIRNEDGSKITGSVNITKDETLDLTVVGLFSDGTTASVGGVTWRISDPTIATVDSAGTISPLRAGIVSVNVRLGNLESNYVVIQISD